MRSYGCLRFGAIVLTCVGVGLLSAAPSQAQDAAERLRLGNERLIQIFSDLSTSHPVQIVTPLVRIDAGSFERVGQDSVVVTLNGVAIPVPLDHIRTVAVQGDRRLQGTLWGLSVGAVAGGVFGLMIGAFNCTSPSAVRTPRGTARCGGAPSSGSSAVAWDGCWAVVQSTGSRSFPERSVPGPLRGTWPAACPTCSELP